MIYPFKEMLSDFRHDPLLFSEPYPVWANKSGLIQSKTIKVEYLLQAIYVSPCVSRMLDYVAYLSTKPVGNSWPACFSKWWKINSSHISVFLFSFSTWETCVEIQVIMHWSRFLWWAGRHYQAKPIYQHVSTISLYMALNNCVRVGELRGRCKWCEK